MSDEVSEEAKLYAYQAIATDGLPSVTGEVAAADMDRIRLAVAKLFDTFAARRVEEERHRVLSRIARHPALICIHNADKALMDNPPKPLGICHMCETAVPNAAQARNDALEEAVKADPLSVACPVCGECRELPCRDIPGPGFIDQPHYTRRTAAIRALKDK